MKNSETCCEGWGRCAAWVVGILGTLAIAAGLVWIMIVYTRPAPVGADRVQLRYKNLREHRSAESDALAQSVWIDKTKGIARIPVERAVELTVKEWANPAAARAELIARMEKATAQPPPVKSEFE